MSAAYTPEMGDRITQLLTDWRLTTAASELVPRLAAAGHDEALLLLAEVFELEAGGRAERRVDRLRKASKLPPGKTFDTLDRARVPRPAFLKVQELARGDFIDCCRAASLERVRAVCVMGITETARVGLAA